MFRAKEVIGIAIPETSCRCRWNLDQLLDRT